MACLHTTTSHNWSPILPGEHVMRQRDKSLSLILAVLAVLALVSMKLSDAAARSGLPWSHGLGRAVGGVDSRTAHMAVTVGQISWGVFWGALGFAMFLLLLRVDEDRCTWRGGGRAMLNAKVVACSLAIWGGISFVLCMLYGLIVPGASTIHQSLELLLPGFKWLTWSGVVIGLAWSLAYGLYAGWLFSTVYNWVNGRWGTVRK